MHKVFTFHFSLLIALSWTFPSCLDPTPSQYIWSIILFAVHFYSLDFLSCMKPPVHPVLNQGLHQYCHMFCAVLEPSKYCTKYCKKYSSFKVSKNITPSIAQSITPWANLSYTADDFHRMMIYWWNEATLSLNPPVVWTTHYIAVIHSCALYCISTQPSSIALH